MKIVLDVIFVVGCAAMCIGFVTTMIKYVNDDTFGQWVGVAVFLLGTITAIVPKTIENEHTDIFTYEAPEYDIVAMRDDLEAQGIKLRVEESSKFTEGGLVVAYNNIRGTTEYIYYPATNTNPTVEEKTGLDPEKYKKEE